jgi:hypothetical protein
MEKDITMKTPREGENSSNAGGVVGDRKSEIFD